MIGGNVSDDLDAGSAEVTKRRSARPTWSVRI